MVPLTERDAVVRRALEDSELRPVQIFLFGGKPDVPASVNTPDLVLLSAVSRKDAAAFREQVAELERRRISSDTPWCDNDCLIFCLLLGCEIFEIDTPLVTAVLDAREQKRNPIPRRVNEAFRALSRKEHSFVEEFAFIKVPYDYLRGQLLFTADSATKIYNSIIKPNFLDDLSPFISLLAIRAYDLVLTERQPSVLESFPQLVEGIEKLQDKLTILQAYKLLAALPVRSLLVIVGVAVSIFGAGMGAQKITSSLSLPRGRPEYIKISTVEDGQQLHDDVIHDLETVLISSHQSHVGTISKVLFVKTAASGKATSKYSVEISIEDFPILKGYAFLKGNEDGGSERMILPVRISGDVLRTYLPANDGGGMIEFLLLVEAPAATDTASLGRQILLRVME